MDELKKIYAKVAKSSSIESHIKKELRDFDSLSELLLDLARNTDIEGVREVAEKLPRQIAVIIERLQEKIDHESSEE